MGTISSQHSRSSRGGRSISRRCRWRSLSSWSPRACTSLSSKTRTIASSARSTASTRFPSTCSLRTSTSKPTRAAKAARVARAARTTRPPRPRSRQRLSRPRAERARSDRASATKRSPLKFGGRSKTLPLLSRRCLCSRALGGLETMSERATSRARRGRRPLCPVEERDCDHFVHAWNHLEHRHERPLCDDASRRLGEHARELCGNVLELLDRDLVVQ
eukprot:Amastigsp_a189_752.p2 type:complete len:218 gc:universal Amastigsp_a189_752:586-1239(+)